ncbi:MAG: hypothetical protein Q9173_005057 [Seirophora scorigena]
MRFFYLSANVGALLFTCRSIAHFSLTQLQPIAGFSDACTQAYETTFDECTLSDFYEGSACSAQCVAYLEAMTTLLNDECRGITAFPNTLIGMFFKKTAIEELCPDVDVRTVTTAGPGQSSTPQIEPTSPSTALLPSEVSVEVMSTTTSLVTSTTVASSILSSTTETSPTSTTTSADSTSSITSVSPGLGAGSTSLPTENDSTSTRAAISTGAQRAQPQPTSESQIDSGAINNGNGGTVLDAASAAGSGNSPEPATISATTTVPTLESDINTETSLDTQRNEALSSLTRIGQLNPTLASALASTYRTLLTANIYIRQQADHHDIDTAWLYCLYLVVGIVALGVGEMGLSFGAKLMGMGKWLLLLPAAGIPAWKMLERRGVGEIVEFLRAEGRRGDEGKNEERRPAEGKVERVERVNVGKVRMPNL